MYTVVAYFPYGSTASADRCTLAQAVAWCEEWLPLVSPEGKVVCLETQDYTGKGE